MISLIYALLQFLVDCCEVYRGVGGILIVGEVIVVSFMLSLLTSERVASLDCW